MSKLCNEPHIHYIKFVRGSISTWNALKETAPEKINKDTLYFIYEDTSDTSKGKLYLGKKLISGVEKDDMQDINITDIGDVYIDDEALSHKQILVYNDYTQRWENASLSDIINTAVGVMRGATFAAAGKEGLVPTPQVEDKDKFLKGDGSWSDIEFPTFDSNIFTQENDQNDITLVNFSSAPVGTILSKTPTGLDWIPQSDLMLKRKITTLEDLNQEIINNTANENTIYMVQKDTSLDDKNLYDEYMIIQQRVERLGSFGQANLDDYVTIDSFNTSVNSLKNNLQNITNNLIPNLSSRVIQIENNNRIIQSKIGDLNNLILSNNNTTLVEEVNTLSDQLKWHSLNN